ncbi:MAG: hypothetical protein WC915_00360 [archaeon]
MPILKKLKLLNSKKQERPWNAPSHIEQLRRVLKGKPAHPNDEIKRK